MAGLQERIQKMRSMGIPDDQIEQSLIRTGQIKTPAAEPVKKKSSLADFIPAVTSTIGAVGGGALGALAGGVGAVPGAIGGGAAGGALGEWIKQKVTPEDDDSLGDVVREGGIGGLFGAIPGGGSLAKVALKGATAGVGANLISKAGKEEITADDLFKSALFGAGGGVVAKGVGDTASRFFKGASKSTNTAAKTSRVNALNPSKADNAGFKASHKVSLKQAMTDNNMTYKPSDNEKIIKPTQDKFTSIAEDPRMVITNVDITKRISPVKKELDKLLSPRGDKVVSKNVKAEMEGLATYLYQNEGKISGKDLNTFIQKLDKHINWDKFPKQSAAIDKVRRALRGTMYDVADASGVGAKGELKTLGQDLFVKRDIQDLALKNEFGNAKSIPGIGYAGTVLGAGAGSPLGPAGAMAGAVAGGTVAKAATSKKVVAGMGRFFDKSSKTIDKGLAAYPSTMAGSRFPAQTLQGLFGGQEQSSEDQASPEALPTDQTSIDQGPTQYMDTYDSKGTLYKQDAQGNTYTPDLKFKLNATGDAWEPNASDSGTSGVPTKEEFQAEVVKALNNGDTKGLARLTSAYKLLFPEGKEKAVPSSVKQRQDLSTAALRARQDAEDIYINNPSVLTSKLFTGGLSPESRKFDSAMSRAVEGLLRARSGAAVPDTEVKKYLNDYGPRLTDTQEVALYKLQQLKLDLMDVFKGNEGVGPDAVVSPSSDASDLSSLFAQ